MKLTTSFLFGFLACYLLAAFMWGAVLSHMGFPNPKVVNSAMAWPIDLYRVARANVVRSDNPTDPAALEQSKEK